MKTKLENGLEAVIVMLALNVGDTDGKFTDGELRAIQTLQEVCDTCFKVAETRGVLDKCIKELES